MFDGDEVATDFSFAQFLYHYWRLPSMDPPPVVHNEVGKPGTGITASHAIFSSADDKTYERCESTSAVHAAEYIPPANKSCSGHSAETERIKKMACCEKTQ